MEYIKAETFLEQPEKVRKILKDWWKANIRQYDLFYRKLNDKRQKYIVIKVKKYEIVTIDLRHKYPSYEYKSPSASIDSWNVQFIDNIVPLFTEGQLRKFIEGKLNGKVDCMYLNYDDKGFRGYRIEICSEELKTINEYWDLGHDLLEAYWQVACEIAK